MKDIILAIFIGLTMTACSSMEKFNSGDQTSEGIQFRKGSDHGIKVGDKVRAYRKRCGIDNPSSKGCSFETIGYLTAIKVDSQSSILKKDGDFALNDSIYFEKNRECPPRLTKSDPICN